MLSFDNYYNKQKLLQESLRSEIAGVAVALSLAMTTGIGLSKIGVIKTNEELKSALQDAQTNGFNVQDIVQQAQQPQIQQQAKQIVLQKAEQKPTEQQKIVDAIRNPKVKSAPPKMEQPKPTQPTQPKPTQPEPAPPKMEQHKDVKQVVADVLKSLKVYSPQAHAVMLANIRGEAGPEMKPRSENLNYSAAGLLNTFSKYFTPKTAKIYARNPEMIGNKVYGNRLGNGADDGYKYRGRGYFQITGKENYERMSKLINVDLVKNPDLVNDPQISEKILKAQIAQMIKRGIDLKNIKSVTKFIGPAKLSDRVKQRTEWYKLILPSLKETQEDLPLVKPVYQTVIP